MYPIFLNENKEEFDELINSIFIDSKWELGEVLPKFSQEQLKYEPMLFSCSYSFAYDHGREPTKAFLRALPKSWRNDFTIVDSRTHMLMKDWYPCIPGYHHDDVPRERSDGQPEYKDPSYRSEHCMAIYNGNICPTEFALGSSSFSDIPLGDVYYAKWHAIVLEKIKNGELKNVSAPENQMIYFNDRTWHQGTKAIDFGWRTFIRATRYIPTEKGKSGAKTIGRPNFNEIRKQVQVYMDNPMSGW